LERLAQVLLPCNLTFMFQKLNTLTNSLERDRQTIARLRTDVSRELQYAELAARTIERMGTSGGMMHLHQQFTLPSKYVPFLSDDTLLTPKISRYFLEVSASFDERMKHYFLAINEIEQYLSASSTRRPYSPQSTHNFELSSWRFIFII